MNYYVTGNEYVALPTIRETDGAIESLSFLHMGAKGMIEMCGTPENPLLKPFLQVNQKDIPLKDLKWRRIHHWLPTFTATFGEMEVEGLILAPVGERGFGYRLKVRNRGTGADLRLGLRGNWSQTKHSINESKPIEVGKNLYPSGWNHCFVMDLRPDLSLFAFAPIYTERPDQCPIQSDFEKAGQEIHFCLEQSVFAATGETCEIYVWFGLGFEEVAAATSAKEMLRQGFDRELEKTCGWLAERERTVGDSRLDEILNVNLFFSFFFGGGKTLDTEEFVLVTSRSPRYYVSAAYWDRDSLLWSFPAILLADPDTAAEMLRYVFTRQIRNVGIHSRYIDGTLLEPGFELDELCAPVIALFRYVEHTGNTAILRKQWITDGLEQILKRLRTMRHKEIALYETFLQPTDDLRVHPYLTYDNVLVWYSLRKLAMYYPEYADLEAEAELVREAIGAHCVKEKDGQKMFAWSVDLTGNWDIYDEPPGSLLLLPYYGFCSQNDAVWRHTVEIIRRRDYPYSFADCPIAEIGCPHAPHPWVLSISNSLLSGRKESAGKHLALCKLDNGIACESVDEYTGESTTGDAFATCAGFLAYAIDTAFAGKKKKEVANCVN